MTTKTTTSNPERTPVDFEVISEQWSQVRILDGSKLVIEMKPIVYEVVRTNQTDPDGKFIYEFRASLVARAVEGKEEPR